MNRLFLVRHGITEWNHRGIYQGQLDAPLSAKGKLQAAALRERLRDEQFDVCYSSGLQRARLTAEIILEEHFCPLHAEPDLDEMSYGAWEGLTRAEIAARYPDNWAQHSADPLGCPPVGGESRLDLQRRAERAIAAITGQHPDTNMLIVAHGGSVRAIVAFYLGVSQRDYWKLRMDNASLTVVDLFEEGGVLSLFNDTAHLGWHKPPLERQPSH